AVLDARCITVDARRRVLQRHLAARTVVEPLRDEPAPARCDAERGARTRGSGYVGRLAAALLALARRGHGDVDFLGAVAFSLDLDLALDLAGGLVARGGHGHLEVDQEADRPLLDGLGRRLEELEALALVLHARVPLGHRPQADALLEVVHLAQV